MKHIETAGKLSLSTFRKIAIGSWQHPRDPQTYTTVELNAEPALAFLKQQQNGQPLSITHFIAKILGDCFKRQPELNSVLIRGKLFQRKEISVFITTLLKQKKGADLSGFPIPNIDQCSLQEIAEICDAEVKRLRRGDDPEFTALDQTLRRVPMPLVTPLFKLLDFFKYTLNWASKHPGMQPDRFGSMIITNIGALGLQSALTPLTACARTPFLAAVGKPFEGAVSVNGKISSQQRISIGFTFDHRYLDGFHGAKFLRHFTKVFEAPEKFESVFSELEGQCPH